MAERENLGEELGSTCLWQAENFPVKRQAGMAPLKKKKALTGGGGERRRAAVATMAARHLTSASNGSGIAAHALQWHGV